MKKIISIVLSFVTIFTLVLSTGGSLVNIARAVDATETTTDIVETTTEEVEKIIETTEETTEEVIDPGTSTTYVKVYGYAYLKNGDAVTQVSDDADLPNFPMYATWNSESVGGIGEGAYQLGNYFGDGTILKYAYTTYPLTVPSDFGTYEITGVTENDVLPSDAECSANRYRLVGYQTGTSLANAESADISAIAPNFTNMNTDQYFIVVNEKCSNLPVLFATPIDVCLNIAGVQESIPEGYEFKEDTCLAIPPIVDEPTENVTIFNDEEDNGSSIDGSSRRRSSSRIVSFSGNRKIALNENGESQTLLSAPISCGIYAKKLLRKSIENDVEIVKKVQQFFNDYTNSGLEVDGIYGSKTETAVKKFQLAHKDKILDPWHFNAPTGIFYITTQTELNNIMCPDLKLPIPTNLI